MFKTNLNIDTFGNAGIWLGVALPVASSISKARTNNQSMLAAGLKSAVSNGWSALLFTGARSYNAVALGVEALRAAPMLAAAATGYYITRSATVRQAVTPFSQRFEHSDMTFKMQQAGLSQINRSSNMIGSEAGIFARRYGRG